MRLLTLLLLPAFITFSASASAMDVVEALPLTERVIMVHLDEGHVEHHVKGQKRNQEKVIATPLDVAAATAAASWTITCAGDPAFAGGAKPQRIGRKSKGTDFAWMVQGWDGANNRAGNHDPDHAKEHWLDLELPSALQPALARSHRCLASLT